MLYSDFANLTANTAADTDSAAASVTYNGVGGRVYFVWMAGGEVTATAAQATKPYVNLTGTGMPGVIANIPLGKWRSAYLAGASCGSVSADATAFPFNANAPPQGVVNVRVRNAATTAAELYQFGIIYGSGSFDAWEGRSADPWNLRDVPSTCITATPTSVTTTAELSCGIVTIPHDYPTVVGLSTYGATNGVRVTAEEFFGTCRYSATGAGPNVQFEPAQNWPFFGQQDAPVGTDIQDESFAPAERWHPLTFKAADNSTINSLITLRTAITNATSFQVFAALK